MMRIVLTVCVLCGAMAIAAPVQAQFGSGVASGLLAGDDAFTNGLVLGRVLNGRGDGNFAGGFVLGRFLSPLERNLFNQRRALERQRLRDLDRELLLARELQRTRDLQRQRDLERALLRRELLRRRGLRGNCD